jgi:hypothetical protein
MATEEKLDSDYSRWLRDYAASIEANFHDDFVMAKTRFLRWHCLLSRFTDAVNLALKLGRQNFSAVDEAHNELCVASALLNCKDEPPRLSRRLINTSYATSAGHSSEA